MANKNEILRAIRDNDVVKLREISNYFFRISGIYSRLCRYMAYLYRYDWVVTPYINSDSLKTEKILSSFNKTLKLLDNFNAKKFLGEAALKVIRNGCYYGYIVRINNEKTVIQELPPNYCRSRLQSNGKPAVEFNMKFFDDYFKDVQQKIKMLKLFPKEFSQGYVKYKEGKLKPEFSGDTSGWYLLDPKLTIKFNMNGEDYPPFISVIPALIDLDDAIGLDKKKMEQQLLKIIVQQLPIDKNGDLIFDTDEAAELHNNVVRMLGRAIGLDVLTTFADVSVETLTDNSAMDSSTQSISQAKSAVYDQAGVSQLQFNSDKNISLEKSILNDEAVMGNLIAQFQEFLNQLIEPMNGNSKKIFFEVEILPTTIYNFKEMAKLYKEQTQLGYSKMLPQIALGQKQSSVLATIYFENDILDLVNVLIPPISSNTMNPEALANRSGNGSSGASKTSGSDNEGAGRPTKESQGEEVSDKTLQNKESM